MIGQATLTTAADNLRITTFLSTPPVLPHLPLYILFHPFQFFLIFPLLRVHVREYNVSFPAAFIRHILNTQPIGAITLSPTLSQLMMLLTASLFQQDLQAYFTGKWSNGLFGY